MFNGKRLRLVRKRRALTVRDLAELVGISPTTITRLEKGEKQPDGDHLEKLASVLRFPDAFFDGDDPEEIDGQTVSFRSLAKTSTKERDAAVAAGSLGLSLSHWAEEQFSLPPANLLDLSNETDPEAAACWLRQHWKLGENPVGNVISLLEMQGVRVFSLSETTKNVDAFSFWKDGCPFIFLNKAKTAERRIFNALHELGHLVLHKHNPSISASQNSEKEADHFASAFLMPAADVRSRMFGDIAVNDIIEAKFRWQVSATALAYRLRDLGRLSDWQYKMICIELGKRGYRTGEPEGIAHEKSVIWKKILSQLWQERQSKNEIAQCLNLSLNELEGLIGNAADPSSPPSTSVTGLKPRLRVIRNS